MKWKDVKDNLKKQGLKDDDEISYIDCFPDESLHIMKDKNKITQEKCVFIV